MITDDYGHLVPDPTKTDLEQRIDVIEARLSLGSDRMGRIEHDVSNISAGTQELINVVHAARGAFKVLNWVAALAKPITVIAVAVGTVYGLYTKFTGRGS